MVRAVVVVSDDIQGWSVGNRGWGWVLVGGVGMGLLATYDALGQAAWWLVSGAVRLAWRLPYVRWGAAVLLVVVVGVVAYRIWTRWRGR